MAAENLNAFDAVVHPAGAIRVGHGERFEARQVAERGPVFVDGGALVLEPVDAALTGDITYFPRGVRTGQQTVDGEIFHQAKLPRGQLGWIARGVDKLDTRAARRQHHDHRLGGQVIDIPPGPRHRSYAGKRVEVNQLLDGSWRVYWQDQQIATAPATSGSELRTLKRRKAMGRGRADL